ncbi:hypothetical protein B0H19DRAFT_1234112 [Mycena capillaripes]|nr:hypothetical protein B0H19DRAFT_1234112 [Mycena capillaripes]
MTQRADCFANAVVSSHPSAERLSGKLPVQRTGIDEKANHDPDVVRSSARAGYLSQSIVKMQILSKRTIQKPRQGCARTERNPDSQKRGRSGGRGKLGHVGLIRPPKIRTLKDSKPILFLSLLRFGKRHKTLFWQSYSDSSYPAETALKRVPLPSKCVACSQFVMAPPKTRHCAQHNRSLRLARQAFLIVQNSPRAPPAPRQRAPVPRAESTARAPPRPVAPSATLPPLRWSPSAVQRRPFRFLYLGGLYDGAFTLHHRADATPAPRAAHIQAMAAMGALIKEKPGLKGSKFFRRVRAAQGTDATNGDLLGELKRRLSSTTSHGRTPILEARTPAEMLPIPSPSPAVLCPRRHAQKERDNDDEAGDELHAAFARLAARSLKSDADPILVSNRERSLATPQGVRWHQFLSPITPFPSSSPLRHPRLLSLSNPSERAIDYLSPRWTATPRRRATLASSLS